MHRRPFVLLVHHPRSRAQLCVLPIAGYHSRKAAPRGSLNSPSFCCCSKSIGDRIPFLTCLRCGLGPVAQIVGDSLRDSRVSVGLHEQTRRYSLSSGHRRTSPSNRQHWYQGGARRRVEGKSGQGDQGVRTSPHQPSRARVSRGSPIYRQRHGRAMLPRGGATLKKALM